VRAQVDGVGDGADDLAEQDLVDVVARVEAEGVDGGVAGEVGLRAVERAGRRRGGAGGRERAEAGRVVAAREAAVDPEANAVAGRELGLEGGADLARRRGPRQLHARHERRLADARVHVRDLGLEADARARYAQPPAGAGRAEVARDEVVGPDRLRRGHREVARGHVAVLPAVRAVHAVLDGAAAGGGAACARRGRGRAEDRERHRRDIVGGLEVERAIAGRARRERSARGEVPRDRDEVAEERRDERDAVRRVAAVAVVAVAAVGDDAEAEVRAHAAGREHAERRERLAPRALDEDRARALARRHRRRRRAAGARDGHRAEPGVEPAHARLHGDAGAGGVHREVGAQPQVAAVEPLAAAERHGRERLARRVEARVEVEVAIRLGADAERAAQLERGLLARRRVPPRGQLGAERGEVRAWAHLPHLRRRRRRRVGPRGSAHHDHDRHGLHGRCSSTRAAPSARRGSG
jgi:hypothetical protein